MSGYSSYELIADVIVLVHALFVLFVIVGQLLIVTGWMRAWTWTRNIMFRVLHLCAIGYVVFEAWTGRVCPLTTLENKYRVLAGRGEYEMSFIGYWLNRILFYTAPEWVFTIVYSVFFLMVCITLLAYPPRLSRPCL